MKRIISLYLFLFIWCAQGLEHNQTMKRVAVFCSSHNQVSYAFKQLAWQLGQQLALDNYGLVTGGSKTGLMKEVVDGYILQEKQAHNVYGILPQSIYEYNVHHPDILQGNLVLVDTLHNRLAQFHALTDVIIILPGGFGTLHELMDFLVHIQLSEFSCKVILFNIAGYWDQLLAQFETMHRHKLLTPDHLSMICVVSTLQDCMTEIQLPIQTSSQLTDRYWEK